MGTTTSTTTAAERAILDSMAEKIQASDIEAAIVFMDGLTNHEDWLMSGSFTVRVAAEQLWLRSNGLHIGAWDVNQAGELALWIVLHTDPIEDEDAFIS